MITFKSNNDDLAKFDLIFTGEKYLYIEDVNTFIIQQYNHKNIL